MRKLMMLIMPVALLFAGCLSEQKEMDGMMEDAMGDSMTEDSMTDESMMSNSMEKIYMKPDEQVLKDTLTPLQYRVTQKNATERAFNNEYWNNHEDGIYVDLVSGEPLFSSRDKFESGTGWPSFTTPLVPGNIVSVTDRTFGMVRTEVRSKYGDSHLGHLFPDGPAPSGLRYCINSASLRFIPVEDLEKEGYGEYLDHFMM